MMYMRNYKGLGLLGILVGVVFKAAAARKRKKQQIYNNRLSYERQQYDMRKQRNKQKMENLAKALEGLL